MQIDQLRISSRIRNYFLRASVEPEFFDTETAYFFISYYSLRFSRGIMVTNLGFESTTLWLSKSKDHGHYKNFFKHPQQHL